MRALQLFLFAAVGALLYMLFSDGKTPTVASALGMEHFDTSQDPEARRVGGSGSPNGLERPDQLQFEYQDNVKGMIGAEKGAEGCISQFPLHPEKTEYQLTGAPMPKIGKSPLGEFPLAEADLWAQANPDGIGAFKDKNFLDAGYLSNGIETVGQNRKTMNVQFRSDPAVPQFSRSVWRPDMFAPVDIEKRILEEGKLTC